MVRIPKGKYKIKKKNSILQNRLFWSLVLAVAALGAISWLAFFSPFLQITTVSVSGNEKITATEIQDLVWPQVEKSFSLGVKSRSLLLVNPASIRVRLLERFPSIDELTVKRILPQSLTIEIKERKATGLWCWETRCFALDKKGVIFEEAAENQASLVVKSKQPNGEIALGKKVIEEKTLAKILSVQQTLSQKAKIEAREFTLFENDQRLNAQTSENWEAFFDLKGDVNWQLVELELVLEKELPTEKRVGLEYVDLRFSKVYYK
ncbi:MAG: FtsQ-type POTRA domain-containing protein [Candidatus Nealsonbacteria bacterium]|nr:FtsQ-type POTRA domain-containing protein [Candidatus Nealsonbacteria bacterium]